MNVARAFFAIAAFGAMLAASGCTSLPGKPSADSIPVQPENVVNFDALYAQNCAGCQASAARAASQSGSLTPAIFRLQTTP
jgi:hypothetical protein